MKFRFTAVLSPRWKSRRSTLPAVPASAAKEIAARLKNELDYPGQIKVTVIREMRAVEYAR